MLSYAPCTVCILTHWFNDKRCVSGLLCLQGCLAAKALAATWRQGVRRDAVGGRCSPDRRHVRLLQRLVGAGSGFAGQGTLIKPQSPPVVCMWRMTHGRR